MRLLRPTEVAPGIFQIPGIGAKVTVLLDDKASVLIDTGARGNMRLVSLGLKALGSSLDRVGLIVVTHHHPDHTGALSELVRATPAKICVHREEAPFISGEKPFPKSLKNPLLRLIAEPLVPVLRSPPVNVDYFLDDGDVLPMAQEVRVVHTPGHTPGSICLHAAARKVLIVGDALQYRFGRLSPPARYVSENYAQAQESLKKLLPLEFDTICFAHFRPLRKNAHQVLERLIGTLGS